MSQACHDQVNEYGDLVGMAYTARDMNEIVDALGEDGILKYWGELPSPEGTQAPWTDGAKEFPEAPSWAPLMPPCSPTRWAACSWTAS